MNKQRRKAIEAAVALVEAMEEKISTLLAEVESAREAVNTIAEEEQGYLDNMSENLQGGSKGQAAEAAVQYLESARDSLQELEDALGQVDLSDITGNLQSAATEG